MHTSRLFETSCIGELAILAAPLMACNVLQQLYATVDLMVVGRFAGQDSFAAVGVAATVSNLWLFAIVGACMGLSVVFAQLAGAGDKPAFCRAHFIGITAGLGVSTAITVVALLSIQPICTLTCIPDELRPAVTRYLTVTLLGLPASYLYNLYSAILRSVGKTGAILLVLATTVAANLALDLLFVAVLRQGVTGAALATTIAQVFSAALVRTCFRLRCGDLACVHADRTFDTVLARKMMQFAAITGFQQAGLYLGKLLVQGAVNTAGVDAIAAYAGMTRIESFANSFGDSGAAATSVLVAHAAGARDQERIHNITRASLHR